MLNVEYAGNKGYDLEHINDYNQRVGVRQADGRIFGPTAPLFNPLEERLWVNTFDGASSYNALRMS